MSHKRTIPAAILAGGRATRLGPLAAERPKALMEVGGRPFIDHQLDLLHRNGFQRVVMCVGHLGEQIQAHVGSGAQFGLQVEFAFDGPTLQGTAGAIRNTANLLGEIWWVLYGDSYLDFDYRAVQSHFAVRTEPALMTVFRNEGRWDTSNVHYDGHLVRHYDKQWPDSSMDFIDYGATLLRRSAIDRIPEMGAADLAELYSGLAQEGLLAGFEISQRFYEIGSPAGLADLDRHLRQRKGSMP
ncbi:MAG: sugar phosphate nucleotidyltransferase [Chloroflexota bacterium]